MNNKIFNCKICNNNYSSQSILCNHKKKFHTNIQEPVKSQVKPIIEPVKPIIESVKPIIEPVIIKKSLICNNCNKIFNNRSTKSMHKKKCKIKIIPEKSQENNIDEIINLKETVNILKNQIDLVLKNNNKSIKLKKQNNNLKNELKNINLAKINNQQITNLQSLTLNNIIITSRSDDNYINATQLCKAGDKQFNDWYCLNNTKEIIKQVDITQDFWIHPKLAIQVAQWISVEFAIKINDWIFQLLTNSKIEINIKLQEENKLKDERIKLLENKYLKKHKRKNYSNNNIIYMLSTEFHLINRIYIIGKTTNLKNRLSVYNKSCDHQVIYYKECNNEKILNLVETMILDKLKKYQEKANRDRFILPIENDISLFTNIIDKSIDFYKNYNSS